MKPYFKKDFNEKKDFEGYVTFSEGSSEVPIGRYEGLPVLAAQSDAGTEFGATYLCTLTYLPEIEIFKAVPKERVSQKRLAKIMPW